jgi:clathrin heavy chain
MESDRWIVSVEPTQLTLVDLQNQAQVTRRPMTAEAVVMNPSSNILALRSGKIIQMFNLDTKAKLKSHEMEGIVFWKWTGANNLALVTATAVFHWSTEGTSAPVQMFTRHQNVGPNTQIINYQVSPDEKWYLLGGISAGQDGGVNGIMQLYSVEKKVSQSLQGHAGAFAKIKLTGREDHAQLLVFHEKKAEDPSHKLFIMEVGRDPSKGAPLRLPPTMIPVPPEAAQDFPVSMVIDAKDDIAFLLSKMGFVYMFDIHSGKTMFRTRITQETVFVTCGQQSTGAVFGITVRTGRVMRIALNGPTLVPYIVNTLLDN